MPLTGRPRFVTSSNEDTYYFVGLMISKLGLKIVKHKITIKV